MLCVVAVFFLWIHSGQELHWSWNTILRYDANKKDKKKVSVVRQDGTQLFLDMDEYLLGVIPSEMPVSFELEALKAQAVAARTYVVQRNYQVDDTVSTQVYRDPSQQKEMWKTSYDTYVEKISSAIAETKDEIITYNGKAISAVFFSSSCGKTANAEEYWENEVPYLKSVDSIWDQEEEGFKQTIQLSQEEFSKALGFENLVSKIETPILYDSGYVKSITIDTITFSGRKIREKLNLRSSSFTIEKKENIYYITTKGYGHGIGMSQYGAQAMAKKDYTYQEIISHYYQGVKIEKMDV